MPALAGQANRLNARLRLLERVNPFNLFISKVPGPNRPLYYAGGGGSSPTTRCRRSATARA
jgi:hypothetical protein